MDRFVIQHSDNVAKWLLEMQRGSYPHKPCLLLTVLDMAEAGMLQENRVTYTPWLTENFTGYFDVVKSEQQHARAYEPFVHISHEGIWTLVAKSGCEEEARRKRSIGSTSKSWVQKHVAHAQIGLDFANRIRMPTYRDALRQEIVDTFFANHRHALYSLFKDRERSLKHERTLREARSIKEALRVPESNRDAAFRRSVLSTYNYTCAATGWRAIVGDVYLLDAAHLIPLSESNDNRVRNGIVLTPTFHRAMDSHLIAPGPDDRWHISRIVMDSEISEHEPIRAMSNRPVDYGGSILRPDRESLEEIVSRLGKSYD